MALIVPKIVYPSGGGTTLTFDYPPRNQPYKTYKQIRNDNLSSAGVRETISQRRDEFINVPLEYVKVATMAGWDSFMQAALAGGTFDYYPDSTAGSFTTCVLEDTDWNPNFKSLGMFTFTLKLRKRVAWP